MRIIKQGNNILEVDKITRCRNCGCVFEFKGKEAIIKEELDLCVAAFHKIFYIACPTCKKMVSGEIQ